MQAATRRGRGTAPHWGLLSASAVLAGALAACGSAAGQTPAAASSSASQSPLAGKTITLIVAGGAGATADLETRAIAPYLAQYLKATVHVEDMPGGGGLKGWNYVAAAKPNGLILGSGNIQGMIANVWEKVPGQNFNPAQLTWLGGLAGGRGGGAKIMFANPKTLPFTSMANLVDSKQPIKELGAVGDVSGPLFFKAYQVPYQDLTDYADANQQKVALLRGDGQVSVKYYAGWDSVVKAGQVIPIFDFTLRPKWSLHPNVETLGTFLKQHPPADPGAKTALELDAAALDAGYGYYGPPGIPKNIATALAAAFKAAIENPQFVSHAKQIKISYYYTSPAQEEAAISSALTPSHIQLMRKYVPLSNGVAS